MHGGASKTRQRRVRYDARRGFFVENLYWMECGACPPSPSSAHRGSTLMQTPSAFDRTASEERRPCRHSCTPQEKLGGNSFFLPLPRQREDQLSRPA